MFENYYAGRKVLVTGSTGFKGSWLCVWLKSLGADVYGLADSIPTIPAMFSDLSLEKEISQSYVDIADIEYAISIIDKIQPDIIFHLAAQAIVSTKLQ